MTQRVLAEKQKQMAYTVPETRQDESNNNSDAESYDDDGWIDYEVEGEPSSPSIRKVNARSSARVTGDARQSPRKRTSKRMTASATRKDVRVTTKSSPNTLAEPVDIQQIAIDGIWDVTVYMVDFFKDGAKFIFDNLRKPFFLCMCIYLLTFMAAYIYEGFYQVFSPICAMPGVSLMVPVCRSWKSSHAAPPGNKTPQWADYSTLMNVQSKTFEQLLEESAGGSGLSLEIKKAEMATSDLIARVRASDLNARDSLAKSLSEFVVDAKKTSRGLQKLTSKVGGAVDSIMAVNDYALQAIEGARAKEASEWSLKRLVVWKPPMDQTSEIVKRTFNEAMTVLSVNMERLILEAEYSLQNLNNLEEHLATLHEIVAREDSTVLNAKNDLLEDLWTRLGGNRKSLRNYDYHLGLLKGLGTYRKEAFVHVVAALQTLRAMSEDMEDMRERVAAPDLIGSSVPVEVHMKSIQMGLDRLREGRVRAKKLEEDAIRKVLYVDESKDD